MPQKPESAFRHKTVAPFLKSLKKTVFFPIQQMAIHGTPDYLLCSHGTFVALEIKTDIGEPTALQEYNLEQVTRCHGVALIARPSNWKAVALRLRKLDQGDFDEY